MKINTTANTPVTVGGEPIREVESFVYLGSVVDGQGGTDRDVTARIGKARAAMVMLKNVWASKVVSIRTKLRIFNSNVKSVLLYGCETWRTTKTMQQKIQTFLNTCLRRIFNIRWPEKIRNEELWERAGQEPVAKQILRRKWGWIGHTLRKPASSTTRQALTWNPQGKRKRGRPRNSWRRDTEAELCNTCEVELGNKLITNGGKKAKLDVPCKYPAVRQQCGDYFFINDAGETRDAFNKKDGNIETDDLFDFSKTKNSIVARAKDGSFDIVFGPFDPVGSKHRNAAFVFRCREDDVPPAFPAQICGGEDEKDVQYMAEELGIKPGKKFKPHMRDQTYYYAIFTDPDLDQTPNPKCGEARDTMLNVCPDDAKRKEAIENCYMILYSKPHRQCATKYSCDLMDVFAACIKFVCSDYTDMEACAEVVAYC
nr:hypothetical protein BaRGS_020557 [Batillaria attramentaria]